MTKKKQKKAIFGAGGFAREVSLATGVKTFFVDEQYAGKSALSISEFNPSEFSLLVCIGDSKDRERLVKRLPKETKFWKFVHPSVLILGQVEIGDGSIICPGCILTCDIKIGKHCILNCGAQVGHDSSLADFCSLMPSAVVSGNVSIGRSVFVGTNAAIREKIKICDDVKIGMGATVFADIQEAGTYVGNPARRIA